MERATVRTVRSSPEFQRPRGASRKFAPGLLLLLLTASTLAPPPAQVLAQEASASERALARRAFRQGMQAARAERWDDARVAFERAYELVHRPRVLLNLATAQVHTGRLVEGAEGYRRFLREAGEDAEPRLVEEARRRLAEVEARIPQLTLRANGILDADELRVDGEVLSHAILAAPLPVDPGPHRVEVLRDGAAVAEAAVDLEEHGHESVMLEVPPPRRVVTVPTPDQVARGAGTGAGPSGDFTGGDTGGDDDSGGGVLRSPWLWIAVGLAVGGGVAAGVLLTRDSGQGPYTGNFGPGFVEAQ